MAASTRPSVPGTPADRPIRALVAAGPTQEPIDAVRFIGNRSSGRMGRAIAGALGEAGCSVTLATGPGVAPVAGARAASFRTAADLLALLRREWPAHDLLVMAAAVADYRPARAPAGKLRREDGPIALELVPTEDILAGLAGSRAPGQYVVGFALERPEDLERSAAAKLVRKRADAIVANPLETMDAPDVDAAVLYPDGSRAAPGRMPKEDFARWLAAEILPRARARRDAGG
jgi:phosphopantothenoylcysteine decarboxylase/phosphopantothenate--cysteine ligase